MSSLASSLLPLCAGRVKGRHHSSKWPDSKLAKEVTEMFSATDGACNQCGATCSSLG